MNTEPQPEPDVPTIHLIGCGAVGQAILDAHLQAGCSVFASDLDSLHLQQVARRASERTPAVTVHAAERIGGELPTLRFQSPHSSQAERSPELASDSGSGSLGRQAACLAIESIYENRDAKRDLLCKLQRWLGPAAVLCSNTSTLPIASLSESLSAAEQCCGMHFFMPVDRRPLVEIVAPQAVSAETLRAATAHVRRIGKQSLQVADTPGFVVNRMLSPYLNQALELLGAGASATQIERVAMEFGMPMSPLELIDWIGTRTAFDAGRVYWQNFPHRIDPTPILPGMVKAKQFGRLSEQGFYSYQHGTRSDQPSAAAMSIVRRYQRDLRTWSDDEVRWQLFLPVLIEADLILQAGVVETTSEIETAMRGGLGFENPAGFFGAFHRWEPAAVAEVLRTGGEQRSFAGAQRLLTRLASGWAG